MSQKSTCVDCGAKFPDDGGGDAVCPSCAQNYGDGDDDVSGAVAYDIALAFDRLLRCALTSDQYHTVLALNLIETNPNVCHSHDYCDANVVMAEAFEEWTGSEPRAGSEEDTALLTTAWDTWKIHAPFRDERAPC